jgi:hypothetical protein
MTPSPSPSPDQPSTSPTSEPPLPEALPAGSVLAHVGIHKTGTTAIQSVLALQRPALLEHGVLYPGSAENHHRPAMALTGTRWGAVEKEGRPVPARLWSDLAAEVRRWPDRAVVSSEFFGDARGAHGAQFRDDLGPDRVHVVLGVRPLPYVLTSAWQQTLKRGRRHSFEHWLQKVYLGSREGNPRAFWSRYSYGAAVRRWAEWVGIDRVSVVVLDDEDHSWQPRVFEALLGLPSGLITGVPPARVNRSLTAAEAEGLRRTNELIADFIDWPLFEPLVRNGGVLGMVENRTAAPDEARIAVPDWAVQHAVEEGRQAVEQIAASGVRILGRLELLGQVPRRMAEHPLSAEQATAVNHPPSIPTEAFAQALSGTLAAAVTHGVRPARTDGPEGDLVKNTSAPDLVRVLGHRVKRRVARRIRR